MCFFNDEFDEAINEFGRQFSKLTPVQQAEMIIREYCRISDPDEALTEKFEDWLRQNAEAAIQADALELYFDKIITPQLTKAEAAVRARNVISKNVALNEKPKKTQLVV